MASDYRVYLLQAMSDRMYLQPAQAGTAAGTRQRLQLQLAASALALVFVVAGFGSSLLVPCLLIAVSPSTQLSPNSLVSFVPGIGITILRGKAAVHPNAAGLRTYLLVIYCTRMTPTCPNARPLWRQQLPVTQPTPP